ncbi:MAG TPA: hypothetical protein V6D15_21475 [Oculatellaceae cyanobacterium]|jgi:hypothetical protein
MTKRKYFWSGLQEWVTNLFRKNPKLVVEKPQQTAVAQISVNQEILTSRKNSQSTDRVENLDLPSLNQKKLERQVSSTLVKSPFILGLDNVNDLEFISSENLINLISWDSINHSSNTNGYSLIDELASLIPETTSTEDIIETIKWDSEPFTSVKPVATTSHNSCFLLGLDDIANLESLVSKDLFQLMNWEVDNYTNLPIEAEDLSLLEDLLNDFPD